MFLLFNKLILIILKLLPRKLIFAFAGRYVAGENVYTALDVTKRLNKNGYSVTLDILGEHTKNKIEANKITEEYKEIFLLIKKQMLDCNISLKPTHIGLDLSKEYCKQNLNILLEAAKENNNFLRIDMEDSKVTDTTIQLFHACYKNYKSVGTVFQSYLFRTESDILNLNIDRVNFRLCKGIYKESPNISIQSKKEINKNFLKLLKLGFKNNAYIGIATHDLKLLEGIYKIIDEMNIPKNRFEFQVLYGVPMSGWLEKHLQNGYKVRVYVPFGPDWYDYSLRRLKENPNILGYVLKNIFSKN